MALIKSLDTDVGVAGDYWRIIAVETHFGGPNQLWPSKRAKPVTFIHLAQYLNKKARNQGAMSLQVKRIVLDGESNGMPPDSPDFFKNPDFIPEPTRAAAYTALKTMRDWQDAIDDATPV